MTSVFPAEHCIAAVEQTFVLTPSDEINATYNIDLNGVETRFFKEPQYGGETIFRSALPTSPKRTDWTGFAWDVNNGKLYLDLNRNHDLTDDPGNEWQGTKRGGYYAVFNGTIPLHGLEYRVGIELIRQGNALNAAVTVKSGWSGTITIDGIERLISIADNLDGVIDRKDEIIIGRKKAQNSSLMKTVKMPLSDILAIEGRQYEVGGQIASGGNLVLQLTELETEWGTLILPGKYIEQLRLTPDVSGGRTDIVFESPGDSVLVPAGKYVKQRIVISDLNYQFSASAAKEFTVEPGGTARLEIGSPLRQEIDVHQKGVTLEITHAFIGIGGEEYSGIFSGGGRKPPSVDVYKGEEKLTQGSFRYG